MIPDCYHENPYRELLLYSFKCQYRHEWAWLTEISTNSIFYENQYDTPEGSLYHRSWCLDRCRCHHPLMNDYRKRRCYKCQFFRKLRCSCIRYRRGITSEDHPLKIHRRSDRSYWRIKMADTWQKKQQHRSCEIS